MINGRKKWDVRIYNPYIGKTGDIGQWGDEFGDIFDKWDTRAYSCFAYYSVTVILWGIKTEKGNACENPNLCLTQQA